MKVKHQEKDNWLPVHHVAHDRDYSGYMEIRHVVANCSRVFIKLQRDA